MHKSFISSKNHCSYITTVTPDHTIIDGQNRADLCTFLASCTTSPSIDKYVHIGKLRIRPTDVAASNIPSGNGSCFSVYIFTALGPLSPPARLFQRYTQPFIARETISIQKMLRWLHCGTDEVESGERRCVTSQLVQRCHSFNHRKHISFISVIFCLAPVNL